MLPCREQPLTFWCLSGIQQTTVSFGSNGVVLTNQTLDRYLIGREIL